MACPRPLLADGARTLCQPSGSLTPLGPKVFTVTLEMYLAAAELPPNCEMCAAGSDSARLALRRTFSPQVFSCSVTAFILFCMLERERQTREKGTREMLHLPQDLESRMHPMEMDSFLY